MKADILSVYGRVKIKQNICEKCRSRYFLLTKEDKQSKYCPDCRADGFYETKTEEAERTNIIYHVPLTGREYIPKKIRLAVYERDNYRCVYCDRNLYEDFKNKTGKITVDHFIPYIGRGEDSIQNLYTCCKRCNSAKYSRLFDSVEEVRAYLRGEIELPVDEIEEETQADRR